MTLEEGPARATILSLARQIDQKGSIADHLRGDRRPRPGSTASRSTASAFGIWSFWMPSVSSPTVSHRSGTSRKTTSEKLSPGPFSFLSRACAAALRFTMVEAIHPRYFVRYPTQEQDRHPDKHPGLICPISGENA